MLVESLNRKVEVIMKKGEVYITKNGDKFYFIVGRWDGEIVLASLENESDEVLIYGPAEFEGLIAEGGFRKLHETGTKVK
jgi:hypothetical protein